MRGLKTCHDAASDHCLLVFCVMQCVRARFSPRLVPREEFEYLSVSAETATHTHGAHCHGKYWPSCRSAVYFCGLALLSIASSVFLCVDGMTTNFFHIFKCILLQVLYSDHCFFCMNEYLVLCVGVFHSSLSRFAVERRWWFTGWN